MTKEVIAFDIDEVLYPFTPRFAEYHNRTHGTSVTIADFQTYDFETVLGISVDEAVSRIYAYHEIDDSDVEPIEHAQQALEVLTRNYDLVNITARNPKYEQITKKWIQKNFPGIFRDIVLIGHAAVMEKPRTKTEVCHELGAFALVDDSLGHVYHAVQDNLEGVLFGDYPWNQARELPNGAVRCKDWAAVQEYFDGIS